MSRRRFDWPLVATLALAAAVRLFRLGRQSLWCDEWFSYNLCRQSLDAIWAKAVHDAVHPPLYYFLLHPIASRTAEEAWLRMPSVVFGVASVWLVYRLARELTNRTTALVAALLMALSAFEVYHSQETRMYELLNFFGLAALWAFWRAVSTQRWGHWALFVVASTLALYTNYLAGAIALTTMGAIATHWRHHRVSLRSFAVSAALIALLWIPWGKAMLEGGQGVNARRKPLSVGRAALATSYAVCEFTTGYDKGLSRFNRESSLVERVTFGVFFAGLACACLLLGCGIGRPRGDPRRWYLLHCLLGPLALGFLVGFVMHFKHPRYFCLAHPAVAMVLAVGIARLFERRSILRWPLPLGLAAATLLSLANYHLNWLYWRDDWRAVAAFMEEKELPGDGLVFNASWMAQPFNHYVERSGREPRPTIGLPLAQDPQREEIEREVSRILRTHDRVWLVLCYHLVPDPKGLVRGELDRRAHFVREWLLSGVTIRLYESQVGV